MLNKNTWGVKKCGANQKQHCKQAGTTKCLILAEAKKLLNQIFVTPGMTHNIIAYIYFHKYDWLCHLATFFVPINYYKRWPSDKANHTCENML